jgi:hypothetical protein
MNNITYLSAFNYGYIEFAKNNIKNYISVLKSENTKLCLVAYDSKSYNEINDLLQNNLDGKNIDLYLDDIRFEDAAYFNTPSFMVITQRKIHTILNFLEKNEILHFFDSDVYFFKNPYDLILEKIKDNDMVFQQDSPRVHNHPLYSNYVCTGNFTAKRNERTIGLLKTMLSLTNPYQNDQEILYNYLNSQCKNIKEYKDCILDVYDPELFQNGFDTFQGGYNLKENKVAIHANHMIGKDVKMNALKNIGAWSI